MRFVLLLSFALISISACGPAKRACSTSTCSGCCDASGECQAGNTPTACGSSGLGCQTCSQFTQCSLGYCMLTATGGGNGGGSGGGSGGGTGGGTGGGSVGGGGGGSTNCGPANCAGCCQGNSCILFPSSVSNSSCGASGSVCVNCAGAGLICNPSTVTCEAGTGGGGGTGGGAGGGTGGGGGASCGAGNCNGCCQGGSCVTFPNSLNNSTCGIGGVSCVNCTSFNMTCSTSSAMCVPPTGGGTGGGGTGGGGTGGGTGGGGVTCSSSNCSGCCQSGSCIPYPNSANNTTCGLGGVSCVNCTSFGMTCSPSTVSCVSPPTGGGGGTGGGVGGGTGGGGFGGGGGGSAIHVGNDVAFSMDSSITQGYLLGTRVTVTQTMTLTHFGVIPRASGPRGRFALYSDSAGSPGALRASTNPTALVVGTQEIPAITPTTLSPGDYWLMGNYDLTANVGQGGTSVTIKYVSLPFTSTLPTTFPSPMSYSGTGFNYYLVGF